ncbi:hypothetical protein O181_084967 [Austropuccinia psidii MF-1]|uniref:Uncharacterized protein n=1 Tax=Austropuccinia psidii MF-1 TaxID=1389203 RepID=A0A9Q3FX76_9BASI|nr:hypothetical protein [Austropuccinia psidii MF-1]
MCKERKKFANAQKCEKVRLMSPNGQEQPFGPFPLVLREMTRNSPLGINCRYGFWIEVKGHEVPKRQIAINGPEDDDVAILATGDGYGQLAITGLWLHMPYGDPWR